MQRRDWTLWRKVISEDIKLAAYPSAGMSLRSVTRVQGNEERVNVAVEFQ